MRIDLLYYIWVRGIYKHRQFVAQTILCKLCSCYVCRNYVVVPSTICVYLILASYSERIKVGRETPVFEFIVEFDYICVKYITELQQFKHLKYWFGVCIIPAAFNYSNNFLL